MKIISPKCDYCMKELFENEKVRRHFISDVLGIPLEEIKSVRLMNTFLWRRYQNQKLGILDVLDFNLTDREEYHSVYFMRDEQGNLFSDMLEIHTLELRKKLSGKEPVDDWIRFFNAETEEDLDMIRTKNEGIREAIRELREMSLGRRLRLIHEARLKAKRDEYAIREYERIKNVEQGREQGIRAMIQDNIESQRSKEQILLKLEKYFSLSREEAEEYYQKFSDET